MIVSHPDSFEFFAKTLAALSGRRFWIVRSLRIPGSE
jgi:hypothetical protein